MVDRIEHNIAVIPSGSVGLIVTPVLPSVKETSPAHTKQNNHIIITNDLEDRLKVAQNSFLIILTLIL